MVQSNQYIENESVEAEVSYALVNRPASIGAIPYGPDFCRVEDRPNVDSHLHQIARHGVAVYRGGLKGCEARSFELLRIVSSDDEKAEWIGRIADGFGKYGPHYFRGIEDAKGEKRDCMVRLFADKIESMARNKFDEPIVFDAPQEWIVNAVLDHFRKKSEPA